MIFLLHKGGYYSTTCYAKIYCMSLLNLMSRHYEYPVNTAVCAAPGSKTFQLLEMIYDLTDAGTLPSGMVLFFFPFLSFNL